jgi:hypothetical protein
MLVALVFLTGCSAPVPAFSGIYIREEAPQNFLEFRPDGSVYSVLNYQYKQIGTWSRPDKDQLQVCYDDYCYEMGIGNNTLFYYREGQQYTLFRVDKLPVITTEPTRVQTDISRTPAYTMNRNLIMRGNVFGFGSSSRADNLESLLFTLGIANGGTPVDVSKITLSYSDDTTRWPALEYVPGSSISKNRVARTAKWGIYEITGTGIKEDSTVLSRDLECTIVMGVPPTATPDKAFEIVLTMPDGSETHISKTVPASITQTNVLY